jgi:multidrug resistance efflux pump
MTLIALMYGGFVYLVFFKFELVPWNKLTRLITVTVGLVLCIGFLVGYENLTPGTSQAVVMARVVDIAPQVGGEVIRVVVKENERVEEGAVLFEIDPTLFVAQVKELKATLHLAQLRLGQFRELAEIDAASRFQIEETEAQVEQLNARLKAAQFNLQNATVRAPFTGRAPKIFLKPGVQVSPARSVLAFVDTKQLTIMGLVEQRALHTVQVGDQAMVNFPSMPGRIFETEVLAIPSAIAEGQFLARGQLESVQQRRMVRSFPVVFALPEEFPDKLRKVGLAANVTVLTEGAGPIALYAQVIQWVKTSLDAIL